MDWKQSMMKRSKEMLEESFMQLWFYPPCRRTGKKPLRYKIPQNTFGLLNVRLEQWSHSSYGAWRIKGLVVISCFKIFVGFQLNDPVVLRPIRPGPAGTATTGHCKRVSASKNFICQWSGNLLLFGVVVLKQWMQN